MSSRDSRWSLSSLFGFGARPQRKQVRAERKQVRAERKREREREAKRFHAVSVAIDWRQACCTARGLAARRFLAVEAPVLPLSSCDSAVCTCRYQHHEDRRDALRRAADEGCAGNVFSGQERRRRNGRRRTDHRILNAF